MELTLSATGIDGRALERVAAAALAEDIGPGDRTSEAIVPAAARCGARILLREPGVVCGVPAAEAVFRALGEVRFDPVAGEGEHVEAVPALLARVEGPARVVLAAERTALNLLGRLCGIATGTRLFVEAVGGTDAVILDTRKTTPALRALEKYAVRCGGGANHRFGLYDAILIKDNHLRLAGGVRAAVERARETYPQLPIEVEAETLAEAQEALDAGATRILLDNMPPELLRQAVRLVGGRAELEASGGVSLETVREIAESGVGFISVGALTHAARSLDVSMEVT